MVLVGEEEAPPPPDSTSAVTAQLSALIWASCPRLQLGPSRRGFTQTPGSRWWARHPLGGRDLAVTIVTCPLKFHRRGLS